MNAFYDIYPIPMNGFKFLVSEFRASIQPFAVRATADPNEPVVQPLPPGTRGAIARWPNMPDVFEVFPCSCGKLLQID